MSNSLASVARPFGPVSLVLVLAALGARSVGDGLRPLHDGTRERIQQRGRGTHHAVPVPFEIVSCSLGCTSGGIGMTCGRSDIHVNEELRVTFSDSVDMNSVNANDFQVVELPTARTPPAFFRLDPLDDHTLVYQPQISFDSAGNPLFGMLPGHTYILKLPGTDLDPLGPYITSADGRPNGTRLQCTLITSLGVDDPRPGPPTAKVYVEVVTSRDPLTGEPDGFAFVPAEGALDVYREGPVEVRFDDLMHPGSLANPITGESSSITLWFDPDGNLADPSDQTPIAGRFILSLDQERLSTSARFQADASLPAAGLQRPPGRVLVRLAPEIRDLADNALANPGETSFVTEAR